MNAAHDPWQARLSEFLDGELAPAERVALEVHLADCAECRALLADLRALVAQARALPARAPERDLWPELARALAPGPRARPWPLILAAFAAGVLVTLGALLALRRDVPEDAERVARGESYLLLLHEPEDFGTGLSTEQHAELVERYAGWARALGSRCIGGDELDPAGLALHPGADAPAPTRGERVGGYFLLETADEREALELARTCPHLEQGGWIELRRVRAH